MREEESLLISCEIRSLTSSTRTAREGGGIVVRSCQIFPVKIPLVECQNDLAGSQT